MSSTALFGLVDFKYKAWIPTPLKGTLLAVLLPSFFFGMHYLARVYPAVHDSNAFIEWVEVTRKDIGPLDRLLLPFCPDFLHPTIFFIIAINVIFAILRRVTGIDFGQVQGWAFTYAWGLSTIAIVAVSRLGDILGIESCEPVFASASKHSNMSLLIEFIIALVLVLRSAFHAGAAVGETNSWARKATYFWFFLLGFPVFRALLLYDASTFLHFRFTCERALEFLYSSPSGGLLARENDWFNKPMGGTTKLQELRYQLWAKNVNKALETLLTGFTSLWLNVGYDFRHSVDTAWMTANAACVKDYRLAFFALKFGLVLPVALVGFAYGAYVTTGHAVGFKKMESEWWPQTTQASAKAAGGSFAAGGGRAGGGRSVSRNRRK